MAQQPKYMQIMDYLREGILSGKYPPGSKLPSESSLMKQFGVSRIVAVNALNRLAETGILYRVHGKGSFAAGEAKVFPGPTGEVQTASPRQIALIVQGYGDHFSCSLTTDIQRAALQNNIFCPMYISYAPGLVPADIENSLIRHVIRSGAEGLLLFPVVQEVYNKELLRLSQMNYPVVLLDREMLGLGFPCVQSDHFAMGYAGGHTLLQAGHEKILYVPDRNSLEPNIQRRAGFQEAMREYGMVYGGEWEFSFPRRDISYESALGLSEEGEKLVRSRVFSLLEKGLTAVVSGVPSVTRYLMELIRQEKKAGLLSLLTFDLLDPLPPGGIAPSCIVQDTGRIAATAVQLLREQVHLPQRQHRVEKIPPLYRDNGTVKTR